MCVPLVLLSSFACPTPRGLAGMVFHLQTQQQQQQQQLVQDLERAASSAAILRAVTAVQELQQLKEVLTGVWGDALLPRGMPLAYSLRRIQGSAHYCACEPCRGLGTCCE